MVHERDIQPHIPVFDKSARRDGTFERDAFTDDHDDDSYVCPDGKRLRPRNRHFATDRSDIGQDGFIRYRARQQDCGVRALPPPTSAPDTDFFNTITQFRSFTRLFSLPGTCRSFR